MMPINQITGEQLRKTLWDFNRYVFLDEITENRIYCGFRVKVIQESTKPCNEVAFNWLG